MTKTKRARQGGTPNLAPTPHQSTINKESKQMLTRNKKLSKSLHKQSTQLAHPTWKSFGDNSVFGLEMSIAKNPDLHWPSQPLPLFTWLCANRLYDDLYKALDHYCKLFPLRSDGGMPSIWASPPPSGAGNTVGIIFGRDASNQLRVIGTNFMSDPARSVNSPNPSLFQEFDSVSNSSLQQSRLIEIEINARMTVVDFEMAKKIEEQAFEFRVMPVYIMAIDGDNTYLGIGLAKAYPQIRPSDMDREFAGEIL